MSSLIAVVVLALGIAVNGTLFTIINAFCLRGLPIESPEQVLFVKSMDARERERGLSWAEYQDVQTSIRAFQGVAAFTNAPVTLGDERQAAARFMGAFITAKALGILREAPAIGRGFAAADDRPGAAPVVLISHGVWQERFGGDPTIAGQAVRVNGTPATVIGVMREGYRFPHNVDVWQPLAQLPAMAKTSRDARTLSVFGRLQPSTEAQALAEVDLLTATQSREYPQTNTGIRLTAVPINQQFNGRITDASWMAFMTVGVLSLLIACASVANLLLARAVRRAPEMAVRASLGG